MDVSRIFSIFIYSYVLLNIKDVFATGKVKEESESSGSDNQPKDANLTSTEESRSSEPSTPQVPEHSLDFKELKEEHGLFKEVTFDDHKFTFFRAFVGQSFNKLKFGDLDLWPDTVTKESVFEVHMLTGDKKFLLSLTTLKREGYLNRTCLFLKEDDDNACQYKTEKLDRQKCVEKFSQMVGSKFSAPWPKALVKDPLFQEWYADTKKTLDNKVPEDLDVL